MRTERAAPDKSMRKTAGTTGVARRSTPAAAKNQVSAILNLQRAAGNAAVVGLLAPVQRRAKKASTGVAQYGNVRLTDRLQDMMKRGVLGVAGAPATLDRDQLFILQGIANVEAGGMDNAVYTMDNMYVSLGFKQVTLGYGELYDIIKAAPSSFAKHGIVLGSGTYKLKDRNGPAIEGASDPVALKTPPWTDRFFDAGGEDEVVSAMVAYTLKALGRMERRFATDSPGKSNSWMKDPTARAWLLEAQNNRPVSAYAAAKATLARTSGQQLTREAFLAVLESEIRGAFETKGDSRKADHIISKIPRVAPSGGNLRQQPAPPLTPKPPPQPAKGAGVDLVDKTAAVLPPNTAALAGAALLRTIAAAGLTSAALRLLAASGHTDANSLTNLAFWSAHPDLFGTKLQPPQHGFAELAAEWTHLRDGVVAEALSSRKAPRPASGAAPAPTPVPTTAATGTPTRKAGPDDAYLTQNTSSYNDTSGGKQRSWGAAFSAAGGTCNVTSLSMALISLAGSEDPVREKIAGLLRRKGVHEGATCLVDGKSQLIVKVIEDPKLLQRAPVQDLVAASVIGLGGYFLQLTNWAQLIRVAEESGLAKATPLGQQRSLTEEKVRAHAKELLERGERVVAGLKVGPGHMVYLAEVRDHGIVIHDPEGALVSLTAPWFVASTTKTTTQGGEYPWLRSLATEERREKALRRVETNPDAKPVMERLIQIAQLPTGSKQRTAALTAVNKDYPAGVLMGARNFYNLNDIKEFHAGLAFSLAARRP